jgi:hypothetical protein
MIIVHCCLRAMRMPTKEKSPKGSDEDFQHLYFKALVLIVSALW